MMDRPMKTAIFGIKLKTTPQGHVEEQTVAVQVADDFGWDTCISTVLDDVMEAFYDEFTADEWRDNVVETPLLDIQATILKV
jgi:formate-dependent nitrite reductase cytochrome c552 subunit